MGTNQALKLSAELSTTVQTVQGAGLAKGGRAETDGTKKPISIEALLHWAYRTECVWELVGAYGDGGDFPGMGRGSAASCLAVGALGGRVDGGPAMWAMPEKVADDALAVHAAVLSLRRKRSGPVIVHARAGTRPEWDAGPVIALEPAQWKDRGQGREEPVYEYNNKAGIGNRPWLCRLRLVDRAEEVSAVRARWREWRESLALLAGQFRAAPQELVRWRVMGALPDAEPWH